MPHGHWKTTTFVAGLRLSGIAAPFVLDGPINRVAFQTYIEQVLVPELRRGDIVVMDNLGSHSRVLRRFGLSRLRDLEPPAPVQRYVRDKPGALIHIDIKKLGRFERVGHRVSGDRTR